MTGKNWCTATISKTDAIRNAYPVQEPFVSLVTHWSAPVTLRLKPGAAKADQCVIGTVLLCPNAPAPRFYIPFPGPCYPAPGHAFTPKVQLSRSVMLCSFLCPIPNAAPGSIYPRTSCICIGVEQGLQKVCINKVQSFTSFVT